MRLIDPYAFGATASDPYFANVTALLHFNGADGSTTFTDTTGKTFTANGNAQIDTGVTKFGTGTGLFDGSGDYLATPAHAGFGFGTGDFTVEVWLRRIADSGAGNDMPLFDFRTAGAENGLFYVAPFGSKLAYYNGSGFGNSGAGSITNSTWQHIAYARASGTLRAFIDGVQQWSTSMSADFGSTRPLRIMSNFAGSSGTNANIDEARITKGVARYTANFTPPAAAFPDS